MKDIPFFANLADGTHCYQAALKMILNYLTGEEWSFEKLDKLSGKLPGKWTWPTTSLLWLLDHGYKIKLIEQFRYEEFAKRGKAYLTEEFGKEVADAQEENSDLSREQQLAIQFAKCSSMEERTPGWQDLEKLFKDDYLIICNINACQLYGKLGYSGHFVVPVDILPDHIVLHDPGLPPVPHKKIERKIFEKAWGYPTDRQKNILAIRAPEFTS